MLRRFQPLNCEKAGGSLRNSNAQHLGGHRVTLEPEPQQGSRFGDLGIVSASERIGY